MSHVVNAGKLSDGHGARKIDRRQMTVMFCDLVSSTALFSELDPEEVSDVLRSFHRRSKECIEAAGGFVAQIHGDGLVSFFGYPEANENDAERAVRAGLDLLEQATTHGTPMRKRLQVRIGIATGISIVGDPLHGGTRLEQGAVGEPLHLAARLQSVAAPNEVIVAHGTRQLIGRLFLCRGIGELKIKGFDQPVQAWRVLRPRSIVNRPGHRGEPAVGTLIGRAAELEAMLRAWRGVARGQAHTVTIVGEAGIGKSRLIREFRGGIRNDNHLWFEGGGTPFFQNTPFYPIAQMMRWSMNQKTQGDAEQIRAALAKFMANAGIDDPEAVPLLAEIMMLPRQRRPNHHAPPPAEEWVLRLAAIFTRWLAALARNKPIVIVLEDLHWMDPSTLRLIDQVIAKLSLSPVLVIRSMRVDPESHVGSGATRLPLERLSDEDILKIVTQVNGVADVSDNATLTRTVRRAEGVPLFGIELARLLLERKHNSGGRDIPLTLTDLLTARFDPLDVHTKRVAQVASVIGDAISPRLIEAVSGVSKARTRKCVALLAAQGIIRRDRRRSQSRLVFTHSLLRDAAYQGVLKSERRALHRRVAEVIGSASFPGMTDAPEFAAFHWGEAGEPGPAMDAWRRAGDYAFARGAFMEGKKAYESAIAALAELPATPERTATELTLRASLAGALQITQGHSAPRTIHEISNIDALTPDASDHARRAQSLFRAWAAASSAGDYERAAGFADQFHGLPHAEKGQLALSHMMQMTSAYRRGSLAAAEQYFLTGEKYFTDPGFEGQAGAVAQTYGNAARLAWIIGKDSVVMPRLQHCLSRAEQNGSAYDLAFSLYMSASQAIMMGRSRPAVRFANKSIELSDKHGFPQFAAISRIVLGRARAGLGFVSDGVRLIEAGLAGMRETSARVGLTVYMTWLSESLALGGCYDDALTRIEEALTVNTRERFFRPESLRVRGTIFENLDKYQAAEQDFREASDLALEMGAGRLQELAARSLHKMLRHGGRAS